MQIQVQQNTQIQGEPTQLSNGSLPSRTLFGHICTGVRRAAKSVRQSVFGQTEAEKQAKTERTLIDIENEMEEKEWKAEELRRKYKMRLAEYDRSTRQRKAELLPKLESFKDELESADQVTNLLADQKKTVSLLVKAYSIAKIAGRQMPSAEEIYKAVKAAQQAIYQAQVIAAQAARLADQLNPRRNQSIADRLAVMDAEVEKHRDNLPEPSYDLDEAEDAQRMQGPLNTCMFPQGERVNSQQGA